MDKTQSPVRHDDSRDSCFSGDIPGVEECEVVSGVPKPLSSAQEQGQKGFLVAQVFTWLQLVAGPGGGCYKGEQSRHRKLALL